MYERLLLRPAARILAVLLLSVAAFPANAAVQSELSSQLGSSVTQFQVTPDGNQVVFLEHQTNGDERLFSAPVRGGTPSLLYQAAELEWIADFAISPDSSRVAFRDVNPSQTGGTFALFSAVIGGSTSDVVALSPSLEVDSPGVHAYLISPDSTLVASVSCEGTVPGQICQLYTVPIAGPASARVRVNGDLVPGGDVSEETLRFSSDSGSLLYVASQTDVDLLELWNAYAAGPPSSAMRINPDFVPARGGVSLLGWTSDDSMAYYAADLLDHGYPDLFSSPVPGSGGEATRLNPPIDASQSYGPYPIGMDPAGGRVLFSTALDNATAVELFSVPIGGPESAAASLSGPLSGGLGGSPGQTEFTPDGSRVVYIAQRAPSLLPQLYSVPAAGPSTANVRLGPALSTGQQVCEFALSPDGSRTSFIVNNPLTGRYDGYVAPTSGGNGPLKIWNAFCDIYNGPKTLSLLAGNETLVLGCLDSDTNRQELRLVHQSGALDTRLRVLYSAFQIDGPIVAGSAGDSWLVFRAQKLPGEPFDLVSTQVPISWDNFEAGDLSHWSIVRK